MDKSPRLTTLYSKIFKKKTLVNYKISSNTTLLVLKPFLLLFRYRTLDKTISSLEMELAAARSAQESLTNGAPVSNDVENKQLVVKKRRYLMVVGINTAFSSRKRRDSIRTTWMPQGSKHHSLSSFPFIFKPIHSLMVALLVGEKRKKLEKEKGIIIRFVIGHR